MELVNGTLWVLPQVRLVFDEESPEFAERRKNSVDL